MFQCYCVEMHNVSGFQTTKFALFACGKIFCASQFLMDMKEYHCRPSRCLAVWESCFIASLGGLLSAIKVNDDIVKYSKILCISQILAINGMERQAIHALLSFINKDCAAGV